MYESDDEIFSIEPDNDLVPLDSGDPDFLRGVEVGYLLSAAYSGFSIHMKVHASNSEMILRISESFDLSFSVEDVEGESDMIVVTMTHPDESDYDEDY